MKTVFSSCRGNALVYVLIAVALLGGLMFTLSKNEQGSETKELDTLKVNNAVNDILTYAAEADAAIARMERDGISVDSIDFNTYPFETSFNTAPNHTKLWHPDGGGLNWKRLPYTTYSAVPPTRGNNYYIGRFNNWEWTPTTAQDVIFTAYGIPLEVCQALNKKFWGSTSIPDIGNSRSWYLDIAVGEAANANFDIADCASCNGKARYCTFNGGVTYTFYSILRAR